MKDAERNHSAKEESQKQNNAVKSEMETKTTIAKQGA